MKKFIKPIIYSLISIFLFAFVNLLFMPKYIEENPDGRITCEFYREKLPSDVIFIGSSTVHSGVSPICLWETYGITSFDRSNSSQTVAISYYTVEETIKIKKPKLVVLDVGFLNKEADYYEEPSVRKTADYMRWSKAKYHLIKASEPGFDGKKLMDYMFPILRYHSRWNDLKSEDFKYALYKPSVTYNGQILSFDAGLPEEAEFEDTEYEEGLINDINMFYLQMLYDLCNENDVQLMLLKLPRFYSTFSKGCNDQLIDFCKNNNIIYKDLQTEIESIGLIKSDYSDTQHLNSYGAEKLSIYLGEYLVNTYNLPNHSTDSMYINEYSKKSERYRKEINNN